MNKKYFILASMTSALLASTALAEYNNCRDECIEMHHEDGVDICTEWTQLCEYTGSNGEKYFIEDGGNGGFDCSYNNGFNGENCVWVDHDGNLKAKAVIENNSDDNTALTITNYTDSGDKGSEIFLEYGFSMEMENFGWVDSDGNIRYPGSDDPSSSTSLQRRDTTTYASDGVTITNETSETFVTEYDKYGRLEQTLIEKEETTFNDDGTSQTLITSERIEYTSGKRQQQLVTNKVEEFYSSDGIVQSTKVYVPCDGQKNCQNLDDGRYFLKTEFEYDDDGNVTARWENNSDGTTKKYDGAGNFLGNYTSIGGELLETPKPAAQSSDSYTNNTSAEASMLVTGHGDNTISIYFK